MIYLLYAHLDQPLGDAHFYQYLAHLPFTMQQRVRQYRIREDAEVSLLGKILLQEGAKRFFQWENILQNIYYTKWNKPFSMSPLSFSISHSNQMVVCVLSEHHHLGIDIEKVVPIEFELYRQQMSDCQWTHIMSATDPTQMFFWYWTLKEAALKADGRGLGVPMKELEVLPTSKVLVQGQEWHLQSVDLLPSYVCQLATNSPITAQLVNISQWTARG